MFPNSIYNSVFFIVLLFVKAFWFEKLTQKLISEVVLYPEIESYFLGYKYACCSKDCTTLNLEKGELLEYIMSSGLQFKANKSLGCFCSTNKTVFCVQT